MYLVLKDYKFSVKLWDDSSFIVINKENLLKHCLFNCVEVVKVLVKFHQIWIGHNIQGNWAFLLNIILFSVQSAGTYGRTVELREQRWFIFTAVSFIWLGWKINYPEKMIESKNNSELVAAGGQNGGQVANHSLCGRANWQE